MAPAVQQSGKGGLSDYTAYANLTSPSQYDIIPAGAPSIGTDPNDSNIWYYNGTPAACTFVALDFVLPRYYEDWGAPDLLVSGPNYGTNLGPFVYSLSGTLGATYAAVERSIPAIATSGSNDAIDYRNITNSTNPATWTAKVAYLVVKEFIDNTGEDQSVLPLGYGINVNIPELTSDEVPPFVKTRLTGEADVDTAAYNETTKLFTWENVVPKSAGVNACYNGDCSLPGETYVVEGGSVSISAFTVDYTAPSNAYTDLVFGKVDSLFESSNSTSVKARRALKPRGRLMQGREVSDAR